MNAQVTNRPAGPSVIERYAQIVETASRCLLVFGGLAIIAMMLHICLDVAGRYFLNRPITGTLEIVSWYYMVACIFLPLAFVQVQRKHLTVEMFTMGLKERSLAALDGLIALLALAYVGLLTWLVYFRAVDATIDGESLALTFRDVPAWPSRWVLPISFGMFAMVLLGQAILDLRFALTGYGRPSADRRADEVQFE